MTEPRLIPLKTMTSDIVKVSKDLTYRQRQDINFNPLTDLILLNGWSHSPMFSIFTDAAIRGRESPENVGQLSAK